MRSVSPAVAQTLSLCFFWYFWYTVSYQFGWHCYETAHAVFCHPSHLCRAINGLALETPMRIKASNDVGTSVAPLQACTLAASQLLRVSLLQACTLAKRCAHPHASCLRSRDVGKSLTCFQLSRILYNSDTPLRCAFPFEGNGNAFPVKFPAPPWFTLAMHFPV